MKKTTSEIKISYIFNPDKKSTKYSFDGGCHWCNAGDANEIFDKANKGFTAEKDACTAYNIASDIEQTHTSVKSSKATLVNKNLGNSFDEVLSFYFQTVASTNWDWVVRIDDQLTVYNMNRTEFEQFTRNWATWDKDRKVIRFKSTSTKMLRWLDERI